MNEKIISVPRIEPTQNIETSSSLAEAMDAEMRQRLTTMTPEARLELLKTVYTGAVESGLILEGQMVPLIPLPLLLNREAMQEQATKVLRVYEAITKVEAFAFSDTSEGNALLEEVASGMTPDARALMLGAKNAPDSVIRKRNTRFDTFFDETSGQIRMIEANTLCPEGILYHNALMKVGIEFLKGLGMEIPEGLGKKEDSAAWAVYSALVSEFAERHPGEVMHAIGIVYETEGEVHSVNRAELPNLALLFEEFARSEGKNLQVIIGKPSDLRASDGKMTLHNQPIDIMWRNTIDPGAYKEVSPKGTRSVPDLMEVMMNPDRYLVYNDERGRFAGYKELMAMLHDPDLQQQVGMTREEIAAIQEIVPFTFNPARVDKVEVNGEFYTPEQYLLKFGHQYVLKPAVGSHGDGVSFGVLGGRQWKKAVKAALDSGDYIAQMYIPYESIRVTLPTINPETGELEEKTFHRDMNLHVINGHATGSSISRACPAEDGIRTLNVAGGGGVQPTLLI